MHTNTLSYELADSLFKSIGECLTPDLDVLGVSEQDLRITTGPVQWQRHQIRQVVRTINSIIYGTLEIHGMPKFPVPAEYAAQAILHCVSPCNRQLACSWLIHEKIVGTSIDDEDNEMEPTTFDKLYKLVCKLSASNKASQCRDQWLKKIGMAVEKATLGVKGATK